MREHGISDLSAVVGNTGERLGREKKKLCLAVEYCP